MYFLIFIYVILVFYTFLVWKYKYWQTKKIPFVQPQLFFGSIKEVVQGKTHFGVLFRDYYHKFQSVPYFGYFKMREPAIIVKDPELVKNIIIKDFNSFANNDFQVDPQNDPIWAQNVFGQTGERWKKNRHAWTSGLTALKVKSMYDDINAKCDVMTEYLKKHTENNPNEPLEARVLASKLFTDIIVSSVFGMETNSFEDPNNAFINITKSFFISTFLDGIGTYIFMVAPWLGNFLGLRFVSKRVENQLMEVAKILVEKRKKLGLQKTNPFDNLLMNGYKKDSAATEFSTLDVAGLIFGFLFDGTETSAGVSGFMLYAIAANPEVQTKLRAEIDEAYKLNGGKLSHENVYDMQYLDMVFQETLRLYNPALIMQRLCTKPYTLPPVSTAAKPFQVPVGMTVIIPMYALHTDPKYFSEPEKFNPDRFTEEGKSNIQKGAYLAFGDGPRICVGTRLATSQLKISISNIIRNFEVRLAPQMVNNPIKIDPNVFLMRSVDNLWVTFHKRAL
ncbi:cytochrome P450 6j1-like [Arctopsyche grandis]|uniref:cytochrome P450 6j1-like n=1 Tax=Arctopsyche grandis TaxID=121162 RepID=UPI00406D860C